LSAAEIVKKYVYFTAACGGPCRFGMYEAEFRTALAAAGLKGFRILSFSQDHGIHASSGHSGLHFTADFGYNTMHAFILGDLLNVAQRRIQPFEVQPGATKRAISRMTGGIAEHFKIYREFQFDEILPRQFCPRASHRPTTFQPDDEGLDSSVRQRADHHSSCCIARTARGRSGLAAREASRQGHRRVLGANDRKRRKLSYAGFP